MSHVINTIYGINFRSAQDEKHLRLKAAEASIKELRDEKTNR